MEKEPAAPMAYTRIYITGTDDDRLCVVCVCSESLNLAKFYFIKNHIEEVETKLCDDVSFWWMKP